MCREVNESAVRSVRDGVGRRPAVLFSPAVQTRDMWLPRQAVQSGRAGHNTSGSFRNLDCSKLNLLTVCVCLDCVDNCPSPLFPSVPPLAAPFPAPSRLVHTHTHTHAVLTCSGQLRDRAAATGCYWLAAPESDSER